MSKTAIRNKIAAADKATDTVLGAADRARDLVSTGIRYNGHGILCDTLSVYSRLHDAKLELEKAMATINTTAWPTNAEYDLVENA